MDYDADYVEELLWDLDEFYSDRPILENAWKQFYETGELSNRLIKKLIRMRTRAMDRVA